MEQPHGHRVPTPAHLRGPVFILPRVTVTMPAGSRPAPPRGMTDPLAYVRWLQSQRG